MTSYSFDAKADKCLMIKPVLVGRRNPEMPSSGMDPRIPVAVILVDLAAMFFTTVYWEHILKLPIDSRLVYAIVGIGLIPTLYLLIGMFLSKGDKEEIKGDIQTMGNGIKEEIKGEIQTMGNTLLRIELLLGGSPVRDHPSGPPLDRTWKCWRQSGESPERSSRT